MRVYIAWSGKRSREIAKALYKWLPLVIHAVKPWMSDEDIDKGRRWENEIANELANAHFGIVCITPDNLDSPWLHFEAGALAKMTEKARVWTYLFQVENEAINQPLGAFQHTITSKRETRKLLGSVHKAILDEDEPTISEKQLDTVFEKYWDELEQMLEVIPIDEPPEDAVDQDDVIGILREILSFVRKDSATKASLTTTPIELSLNNWEYALQEQTQIRNLEDQQAVLRTRMEKEESLEEKKQMLLELEMFETEIGMRKQQLLEFVDND